MDKLNDGSRPLHKTILDKIKNKLFFKPVCYTLGAILMIMPIAALFLDIACVEPQPTPSRITYCWGSFGSSIYNVIAQIQFFLGLLLVFTPCVIKESYMFNQLISSHLWHILEELTFAAFCLQYLVVTWFFSSRSDNTLLSTSYILYVTLSSCVIAYILAVPFYLLVERPFKNFLDLILFPKSSIFKRHKDLDDEETEDEDDVQTEDPDLYSPVLMRKIDSNLINTFTVVDDTKTTMM